MYHKHSEVQHAAARRRERSTLRLWLGGVLSRGAARRFHLKGGRQDGRSAQPNLTGHTTRQAEAALRWLKQGWYGRAVCRECSCTVGS
eukprot:6183941-Pleurochrysis_carterae.AAC.3